MKKALIVINAVLLAAVAVSAAASVLLHCKWFCSLRVKAESVPFELITDDSQLDFDPDYFSNYQKYFLYGENELFPYFCWRDKVVSNRFNGIQSGTIPFDNKDYFIFDETFTPPRRAFYTETCVLTTAEQQGGQYLLSVKKRNQMEIGFWNKNNESGYLLQYDFGFKVLDLSRNKEIPLRFYDLQEDVFDIKASCYWFPKKTIYVIHVNDQILCAFSDADIHGALTITNAACYDIKYNGFITKRRALGWQ